MALRLSDKSAEVAFVYVSSKADIVNIYAATLQGVNGFYELSGDVYLLGYRCHVNLQILLIIIKCNTSARMMTPTTKIAHTT